MSLFKSTAINALLNYHLICIRKKSSTLYVCALFDIRFSSKWQYTSLNLSFMEPVRELGVPFFPSYHGSWTHRSTCYTAPPPRSQISHVFLSRLSKATVNMYITGPYIWVRQVKPVCCTCSISEKKLFESLRYSSRAQLLFEWRLRPPEPSPVNQNGPRVW